MNIASKSDKLNWYNGPHFIQVLDEFKLNEKLKSKFIRFPVQDIYKVGEKRVIVGRIESGKINLQDGNLIFMPSNEQVKD